MKKKQSFLGHPVLKGFILVVSTVSLLAGPNFAPKLLITKKLVCLSFPNIKFFMVNNTIIAFMPDWNEE